MVDSELFWESVRGGTGLLGSRVVGFRKGRFRVCVRNVRRSALDGAREPRYMADMEKSTMRAVIAKDFGGPEVLQVTETALPQPPPGHVRVRVRASSVNPIDTKIRRGMLKALAPDPVILGCDVAGEVDALGERAGKFAVGDAVYGCAGGVTGYPGALAEYMICDEALLARKPERLSWEEAAALPLVTLTAWEGLIDRANVQAGQTVLVHGGAGGVGHLAVQLAAARGAEVWATVSTPEKAKLARELGAKHVIFYKEKSVEQYVEEETGGKGFDIVFDTVGGDNVARCLQAAKVSGTVVSISTRTSADLSPMHAKGLTLHVVFMIIPMLYRHAEGRRHQGKTLEELAALVEAGRVRPLIDPRRFSFEDAASAHALLESGEALGKIVLGGF